MGGGEDKTIRPGPASRLGATSLAVVRMGSRMAIVASGLAGEPVA